MAAFDIITSLFYCCYSHVLFPVIHRHLQYHSPVQTPVYYNDAISLFTREYNSSKIDNLINSDTGYLPIQIGAFRQKSNADKMYFR